MAQFEGSLSDQVSTPLVHDTEQSWTSRALDSFLNAGKEAVIDHPVQTSGSLVAGFVVGDGVQRALTAAESMGGKIAMSAKVAELAFAVAPFVYMSHRIYTADDSAKEAGQAIFDTSLFVGTASLGRAWRFSKYEDAALQSGKITHPGLSLEDAPRAAALASSDTAMKNSTLSYFAGNYEKNHADGVVSKFLRNKTEIRTTASNDILAVRPNGDQVTFHENGMISALQGVGPGVKQWEFRPDQSFTMRQGNHTMRVGADGRGMSDFPQPGESELLRPGLGALQGKIFSLSDVNFDRVNGTAGGFKLPDVTPIPKTDVELLLGAKRQFALKEAGQAANYDVSSNVVPQSNMTPRSTDTTRVTTRNSTESSEIFGKISQGNNRALGADIISRDGKISAALSDGNWVTVDPSTKAIHVYRPNHERVTFHRDGNISAIQPGVDADRHWLLAPDRSISMRNGSHSLAVDSTGKGWSTFPQYPGKLPAEGIEYADEAKSTMRVFLDRDKGTVGNFKLPDLTRVDPALIKRLLSMKSEQPLR